MNQLTDLNRRRFLQGTGIALALPLMESQLSRAGGTAGSQSAASGLHRQPSGVLSGRVLPRDRRQEN